jgi:hypothetical protein
VALKAHFAEVLVNVTAPLLRTSFAVAANGAPEVVCVLGLALESFKLWREAVNKQSGIL